MPAARKPLAAMMTHDRDVDGETYYGSLVVVCDDGAVFTHDIREDEWRELAPVPGTRREPIKARKHAIDEAKASKEIDTALRAWQDRTAAAGSRAGTRVARSKK